MSKGTVWGCNALYRDVAPHFLIAVDKAMQDEILKAGYHLNNICYFKQAPNQHRLPIHQNIRLWSQQESSPNNSGLGAIYLSMKAGHRTIYLVGIDLKNPKDEKDCNIYAGTDNYKKHNTKPPKITRGIMDKIDYWTTHNLNVVKFVRVVNELCWIPPEHRGFNAPYMENISYEELANRFGQEILVSTGSQRTIA
jgi:uncharacterized protein with LGFP repeats